VSYEGVYYEEVYLRFRVGFVVQLGDPTTPTATITHSNESFGCGEHESYLPIRSIFFSRAGFSFALLPFRAQATSVS